MKTCKYLIVVESVLWIHGAVTYIGDDTGSAMLNRGKRIKEEQGGYGYGCGSS